MLLWRSKSRSYPWMKWAAPPPAKTPGVASFAKSTSDSGMRRLAEARGSGSVPAIATHFICTTMARASDGGAGSAGKSDWNRFINSFYASGERGRYIYIDLSGRRP